MAKKFIIKDDDGKEFEVTEETVDEQPEVKEEPAKPEVKDDESLTPEEIVALKALAAHSADIIKLLSVEAEEHAEDTDECQLVAIQPRTLVNRQPSGNLLGFRSRIHRQRHPFACRRLHYWRR